MEMPTLQDIFYCMDDKITSPELEDNEKSLRRVLKMMIKRKLIKRSAAEKIADFETETTRTAKCAGFVYGFAFAVKLFFDN